MATTKIVDPNQAKERARLMAELSEAQVRAGAKFKGDLIGFAEEEAKVAAIVARIKEIDGTTGLPWNA